LDDVTRKNDSAIGKITDRSEAHSAEYSNANDLNGSSIELPRASQVNAGKLEKTKPNFYFNLKVRSSQRYPSKDLPVHSGGDIDVQNLETKIMPQPRLKLPLKKSLESLPMKTIQSTLVKEVPPGPN
jgi:hypothetical protein